MKAELKNIKVNLEFSEETIMFRAVLYINNKPAAYCENDGRGGCTYYHAVDARGRELLKEFEAYVDLLPEKNYGDFKYKLHASDYIDDLINAHIKKKDEEKFDKKLQKMMVNSIVVGNDTEYVYRQFSISIADIQKKQPDLIRKNVAEMLERHKDKEYRLLNTNISYDTLVAE